MTLPLIAATNGRCITIPKNGSPIPCVALATDVLVFITFLVVGILGATSVIAMSPAAAYSLIGISCAIILAWVALFVSLACSPTP